MNIKDIFGKQPCKKCNQMINKDNICIRGYCETCLIHITSLYEQSISHKKYKYIKPTVYGHAG